MNVVAPVRGWLHRTRGTLAVLALVLLAAVVALALVRPTSGGLLDPENPAPEGGRALAHVLRDHGVDVRTRDSFDDVQGDVETAADDRPVTVLVARPDLLPGQRVDDLLDLRAERPVDLVLVAAGNALLSDLDLPVGSDRLRDEEVAEPGCDAAVPDRAGAVRTGHLGYRLRDRSASPTGSTTGSSTACYPVGDGLHGYVEVTDADAGRTTLLASPATMSNAELADQGNAALAVGALGRHPVLVWWTPDPFDVDAVGDDEPAPAPSGLLPAGFRFGALQLVLVLPVLLLWRGRRLGRLVGEPLPVQVRAIETTRGRAQLYRRARARGRAAQVLRATAVRRLAVRCGLPRTAPVPDVLDAVARVTGRAPTEVAALLVGPDPTDDPALVLLARALDALETEVHRS